MTNFPIKIFKENTLKKILEIQKQNNEKSIENTNQYNLKTVLDQFYAPKPVGIQDLQNEISKIKLHINKRQNQNQDIETRLPMLEHAKLQTIENIENEQLEEGESSQLFVNTIIRMSTQKWQLFIKPDFSKE